MRNAALLLILLTGAAAAQTQRPAPAPAPAPAEERPAAAPSRPLNLKLDGRASDYTREAPRESQSDNLPGLGEGAIDIKSLPTPRSETVRTPYPADYGR